jgi:hypothetical protein
MALRIHKEKVATLKPKRVILDVPHIQEATVPHIQEVISNVRQISPTRFDKTMAESMDIINKNRILIDNYYVDLRWQINGIGSFENIVDALPIEAPISQTLQCELPQESLVAQSYNNEVSKANSYKETRPAEACCPYKDTPLETLDEKEIRLRKILIKDISKPAPLKRKRSTVIEVSILAQPLQGKLPQEGPRLIPKKKKRTDVDHIIVF